jgi:hypothetical protein
MFWLNVATTFNFEDPKKSLRISFVELSAPKDIIYFESQMLELNDGASLVELKSSRCKFIRQVTERVIESIHV